MEDDLDAIFGGTSTAPAAASSNPNSDLAAFDPLADFVSAGAESTPAKDPALLTTAAAEFDPFSSSKSPAKTVIKAKKLSFEEETGPTPQPAPAQPQPSIAAKAPARPATGPLQSAPPPATAPAPATVPAPAAISQVKKPFDGTFGFNDVNDGGFSLFQDLEAGATPESAPEGAPVAANSANAAISAFGEEVEYPENDADLPNPFCYDRFTEARANAVLMSETKVKPVEGTSIQPRPRPKPQRADSLSGNNPFRKASPEENGPEESVAPIPAKGFDPLETIYPESDDSDEGAPRLNVHISSTAAGSAASTKASGKVPIPLLPAPPRAEDVIALNEMQANLEDEDDRYSVVMASDRATELWNTTEAVTSSAFDAKFANSSELPEDLDFSSSLVVETFEPFDCYEKGMTWRLMIRMPEQKIKTKQFSRHLSDRFWKEILVRVEVGGERPLVHVYEVPPEGETASNPVRSIRLEPTMQLSHDKLQQYDKYGKLHIFKINLIEYKEIVGMRTEKFTLRTFQNFMGHKPKGNMVFDHIPIRTEIIKFGSMDKRYLRSLMAALEDALMSIQSHRNTALEYAKEELCCYVQDEYEARLDATCNILQQRARTRVSFVAFVMANPYIILGMNDIWRFGKEIVRRQDIIPMLHDEWIHIYEPEFHSCVNMEEYEKDHMIKFHALDGCKVELMRFRVSLRDNRELPLTCRCTYKIDKLNVSIRCDLMAPGFFSASKRHGSTHCNDIEIRIPIPEEWIYHFRTEKGSKYGSMHSVLRKPGKIKGFERISQIAQGLLPPSLLETSTGVAKYEHLYKSLVWRIPKLPEKHEGAFKPHLLTCKLLLAAHDAVPDFGTLKSVMSVEYSMNSSTVSGATVRSISVEQHEGNPEKFVKYLAKYEYTVDILYDLGEMKAPALKSIWDDSAMAEQQDSDSEPEEVHKPLPLPTQPAPAMEGDLLGDPDVLDPRHLTTAQTASNHATPSHKSNLDELMDIFSSGGTAATSQPVSKNLFDLNDIPHADE